LHGLSAWSANRFKFKAIASVLVGQDFYVKPLFVPHQTKCGTGFFRIMLKPTPPRSAGAAAFSRQPAENHSRPGGD
jgi:hypothetical protein